MRFATDKSNRLVIKRKNEDLTINGSFSVDSKNRLIYLVNEPAAWRRKYGITKKIIFEGTWRLDENHDLVMRVSSPDHSCKDDLVLRGKIIAVSGNALVFGLESNRGQGRDSFGLLELKGIWQANQDNRIIFAVEKRFLPDTLIFIAGWQVDKNQEIVYTYKKNDLKRKDKLENSFTFQGHWLIDSQNQLTYILSGSSESRFDFRAQLESPSIYAKDGQIRYRIGVGLSGQKRRENIISLFGVWKFSRLLGLSFEMRYGQGRIESIEFGADADLSRNDKISFNLVNKTGKRLGINLIYTHKFIQDNNAQAFLRFKRLQKESGVDIGIRIPF